VRVPIPRLRTIATVGVRRRCRITIPDLLAVARVILVPVVMVLVRSSDRLEHAYGYALALFVVAALTDFFDGYLARRMGTESTLGAFLDTTADKLLVTGTLFALVSVDRVSIWAAVIIVMREFIVMALRGLVAMAGSYIAPSAWGKVKATVQFTAIGLAFVRLPEPWGPMYLDQWAMWVAVAVTIASGWQYLSVFMENVRAARASAA
jgi:CDP-diacylglycerol--glycerol-3-phosphate 3-phosphatidyltransferase